MKHVEIVAAIFVSDKKLAAFRRNHGEFKGYYEFVGGKIKPNESHQQALMRECKEELDVDVTVHDLFKTISYPYDHFNMTLHLYHCQPLHFNFKLTVHDDVVWVDTNQIDTLPWLPADLLVIDDLKSTFLI